MAKQKIDSFKDNQPQRIILEVVQGAANAAVNLKIPFATSVRTPDNSAVEIIKVVAMFRDSQDVVEFVDNTDELYLALSMKNADIGKTYLQSEAIFFHLNFSIAVSGAPANAIIITHPWELIGPPKSLDGRGVVLPPDNLYVHVKTFNFGAAVEITFVIYYRNVPISDRMSLEMLQNIIAISNV